MKRYSKPILLFFLITAGLLLRLKCYLENPSLWLDEAALVLTIIRRSFKDIFLGYDYNPTSPTAPIGFLMLEKGAIQLLGNNELVLRAFPFLCSAAAVCSFFMLAKRYTSASGAVLALALFALAGPLIRYAGEVKPYSCDVFVAVVLLLLAYYMSKTKMSPSRIIFFGFAGAAALWFSYAALFVLGGALGTLMIFDLRRRKYARCASFGLVAYLWVLSFLGLYFVEWNQLGQNKSLYEMWAGAFLPWTAGAGGVLIWLKNSFSSLFSSTMGFSWPYLAAGLFLLGSASLFSKDKEKCFLLISPLLAVVLAAAVHKYPFSGRFLLFLVPSLAILIAEGMAFVGGKLPMSSVALRFVLMGCVFFFPLKDAADIFIRSHPREEMRPVMRHFKEHYQPHDAVYLNNSAQYAYGYYRGYYGLDIQTFFEGIIVEYAAGVPVPPAFDLERHVAFGRYLYNREGYAVEFRWGDTIKDFLQENAWNEMRYNKRTWLIFSHFPEGYEGAVLDYFNKEGKMLDDFHAPGASIYLYDLSRNI
ncbi:MAG: hypothetical protein A3G91_03260 [Omnitrophica WOR_2 bacterium RIFCSPLOWO2_12_FULL_50_9]|nr:MAG: hypothetical protein A3D87_06255 [Omnitrophica WOR_2 bacterium RIFCSPHIGHO2_02_FULL_50_17]OGX40782.1 MAG: hypothetical protein A3G91_03260 [Omnitrophica WOR_2 bacterium RIFCSPLOWO2_12_FULL_50_9]